MPLPGLAWQAPADHDAGRSGDLDQGIQYFRTRER